MQNVINALQWGSFYALIALGYTMVYGVLLLINFAHGDIFMVGAYIGFFISTFLLGAYAFQLPWTLSGGPRHFSDFFPDHGSHSRGGSDHRTGRLPASPAKGCQPSLPGHHRPDGGIASGEWKPCPAGGQPEKLSGPDPQSSLQRGRGELHQCQDHCHRRHLPGLRLLQTVVLKTKWGMAMRAISYDRVAVPLMGIPVDTIIVMTFVLGSSMAAVAGILFAVSYPVLEPYMGALVGWKAFISAVVGGIGDIRGAFVGGLILGFTEIFVATVFPSTFRDLIAFGVLLLILDSSSHGDLRGRQEDQGLMKNRISQESNIK